MINFDTPLDSARAQGQRTIVVTQTAPVVRETLTLHRPPSNGLPQAAPRETRTTDVGKRPECWEWEDIRNYVMRQIETFSGPFPVDPVRLKSIFYSFKKRHGKMAGPIAVAAFDLYQGKWMGAPISVNRFCTASDKCFADVLKQRLTNP